MKVVQFSAVAKYDELIMDMIEDGYNSAEISRAVQEQEDIKIPTIRAYIRKHYGGKIKKKSEFTPHTPKQVEYECAYCSDLKKCCGNTKACNYYK